MHGLCRAATRSPEAKLEPHWNHGGSPRERRKPPLRAAFGVLVGLLQGFLGPYATVGLDSGGGIRTRDLRVMSPTSYQTAPPRGGTSNIATVRPRASPVQGALGAGSSLSRSSGAAGSSPP